jgi:hypothetical protein
MVHALERARQHLVPSGVVICLQPRRVKRPFIAVRAPGHRQPVGALINPVSEPLFAAAEAAINSLVDEGLFVLIGKRNDQFRVRIANPGELDRYLHAGQRPPRFPAGGRQRLQALWKSRMQGAQIEVTEFLTIIALRKT